MSLELTIPGTKRRKYLEENAKAVDLTLTPDDLAELNRAAPVGQTAGTRYAPASMAALDR